MLGLFIKEGKENERDRYNRIMRKLALWWNRRMIVWDLYLKGQVAGVAWRTDMWWKEWNIVEGK